MTDFNFDRFAVCLNGVTGDYMHDSPRRPPSQFAISSGVLARGIGRLGRAMGSTLAPAAERAAGAMRELANVLREDDDD